MTNTNALAAPAGQTGKISVVRPEAPKVGRGPESAGLDAGIETAKTVAICDTQPVMAEGIRTLLNGTRDVRFLCSCESLWQTSELLRNNPPDVLVLDKGFGI